MPSKLKRLLLPISRDEELARREQVLNVILVGSLFAFSLIYILFIGRYFYLLFSNLPRSEGQPIITTLILLVWWFMLLLSKKGYANIASRLLVGLIFFAAAFTAYEWQISTPQGLLLFALVIVVAGIITSTRFMTLTIILSIAYLFIVGQLQFSHILNPDISWKNQPSDIFDVLVYSFTLSIIALVSGLFNREIAKALHRAKRAEIELRKERDSLEVKVEERTQEIKRLELEKLAQITRFAEIGRMTSGMLHDLTNPLTAISLNLEQIKENPRLHSTQQYVRQALAATKKAEEFSTLFRKQLKPQEEKRQFLISQEIEQSIIVLSHKSRSREVEIVFNKTSNPKIIGTPNKLHQVVTNLISNAIDAYEGTNKNSTDRKAIVKLSATAGFAKISVQDNGRGMTADTINKIFDPFFTTKDSDSGTGLGLWLVKDIINSNFNGQIDVKSQFGQGSEFIISIPLPN